MGTKASKPVEVEPPKLGKSGKKICCSCPETKKVRCGLRVVVQAGGRGKDDGVVAREAVEGRG